MASRQQPCISISSTQFHHVHLTNIQQLRPILVFVLVSPRPLCPREVLIVARIHMRLAGLVIPCQHPLRDLPTAHQERTPWPPADPGTHGLAHHTPSVDPDSWSEPFASSGWPLKYGHLRNHHQTYWARGHDMDRSSLVGRRSQGRRGRAGWG